MIQDNRAEAANQLEWRSKAATAGEWKFMGGIVVSDTGEVIAEGIEPADAEFIATLRPTVARQLASKLRESIDRHDVSDPAGAAWNAVASAILLPND